MRFWSILVIALSTLVPARSFTPPRPHPLVQKYRDLKLGKTWSIANYQIAKGHAVFSMEKGELTEILAGGQTVGVYFRGEGFLDYLAADKLEHAVMTYNLEKNASLRAKAIEGGLNLVEPFKEAAYWFHGEPLPAPLPSASAASTATTDAWGFFLQSFSLKSYWRGAQASAFREMERSGQPYLHAEIKGVHDHLIYVFDPEYAASEILGLKTLNGEALISTQAIGWDRRSPLASLLTLSHVEIDLTAHDADKASLTVVETLVPTRNGRAIWLDLIGPGEETPGGKFLFGAVSVQDESGRELAFDHRAGKILVELKDPAVAGKPLKLRFQIEGELLFRPNNTYYWKLGVYAWFPQPDLAGQAYSVHATVRVKKPFIPILPGTTVRRVEEGEYTLVETRIDRPVQFFVMDAGRFSFHKDQQGDRVVTVATYGGSKGNTEKLGRMAHQYIQLYELLLGPFPFKEFNIIHQKEYGYGQAPPGTMYITDEAFDSISSMANLAFSRGVNHRFAHEIAHQYWGHRVKMPSYEEQWLTESFAEYCSAIAILRTKGFGEPKYAAMVEKWGERAKAAAPLSTIPEANRLRYIGRPMDSTLARQALIYDKGALILYALHKEMGDNRFLSFLQALVRSFDGKFATTLDVLELASLVGKKDYSPLFSRCFWGTELP